MAKRITILGAGESGIGAAILAKKLGYDVFVSDSGEISEENVKELQRLEIRFEKGQHSEVEILNASLIVKSPGIPDTAVIIQKAVSKTVPVLSEPEFASRYFNGKIIAITGTNGKTTTTLLTYHLLKEAGLNVGLAGNVGISFARQVALEEFDIYVLEMSSFQLDNIVDFKANIAILLNITPDHLDRYDNDFEKYAAAKFRISENLDRSGHFIYNYDDTKIRSRYEGQNGFFLWPISQNDKTANAQVLDENFIQIECQGEHKFPLAESPLIGKHNIYNTMAALMAGRLLGIAFEVLQRGLKSFVNAEHRLEFVAEIDGIKFINDSKATNVDSVYYALEGVEAPIIWIAGGVDKGNDYKTLYPFLPKIKTLLCLGIKNQKLHKAFDSKVSKIKEFDDTKKLVKYALQIGKPGDTVLLSPACASFDLFKNYMDRGMKFKEAVFSLQHQQTTVE